MHEAYKKGLIDPELFTEDTSMSVAKRMDKGVSRVGVSSGWTADATFGPTCQRICSSSSIERAQMANNMSFLTQII